MVLNDEVSGILACDVSATSGKQVPSRVRGFTDLIQTAVSLLLQVA